LAFTAYQLPPRGNHTQARDYPCGIVPKFKPFKDASDTGQAALLQELPSGYDVFALGNVSAVTLVDQFPNLPPNDVLERMFNPVGSSLNPHDGGLGIYRPDFIRSASRNGLSYEQAVSDKLGGFDCATTSW
jgi:hypothetical protein